MTTQVHLRDGRTLTVKEPLSDLEQRLADGKSHVVTCLTVTRSGTTWGPSSMLLSAGNVRLLVDSEGRPDLAGWDIIDDD
jgi:hypothetical protein